MSEPIRLLYAEDNAQDADLTRSHFEREAPDLHLDVVDTGARCLERLAAEPVDLLLLDNRLPDMEGLDVLARIGADGHTLPVVMVTGVGDDETVVRALRAGVADYVPKAAEYLVTLPGIVRGIVARERSRTEIGGNAARRVQQILYVEPNTMDAELTAQHLSAAAPHLILRVVPSSLDALTLLAPGHAFDLVLTDLRVPGMNALEFLREARHRGIELPFIVITGRGDEATAVAILRLGASDYLVKRENYLTQLPHAIDHALHRSELDRTTRRLHAELEALNASLEQRVAARTADLEREATMRARAERNALQLLDDAERSRRALLGVLEDQARTTDALRQNETLLRIVTDNASVGLAVLDPERRYLFANAAYATLVGRPGANIVGQRVPDVIAEAYEAQIRPKLDRAFAGERVSYEMQRSHPEGERHFAATYEPVKSGDSVSSVVVVVLDITERKLAAETLRANERLLSESQRIAHVGSWRWNLTGPVHWTDELYRVYGVSPETFTPTIESFFALVYPEDRPAMREWLRACGAGESSAVFEFRAVRPDGTVRIITGRGELVRDAGGRPIQMTGTAEDITERKQAERAVEESREQLRQLAGSLLSAREDERAEIARNLHDELGQVLSALKMDVAWLSRHVSDPESRLRPKVEDMLELANTAIRTVQQLATEFRPDLLDDLGLTAAIAWHADQFRQRSGIPCLCTLDDTPPDLDPQKSIALYRIVQECLTNIGRHARATEVRVAVAETEGHLILEVADNGRGITEDELRRSRSIGLAGMRERAQLVGGTCAISGEPGKGTTVRVDVPLDPR